MQWWVIPEGFLGKLVNALGPGISLNLYTVKQSATQPPGAVAGPYPTQAQAQAKATALNQAGSNVATLPNIGAGAAQSAVSSVTQGIFTQQTFWSRVGESVAGAILLYVGAKALFPQQINNITQPVKNITKGAAKL